jgi:hypothetical protein
LVWRGAAVGEEEKEKEGEQKRLTVNFIKHKAKIRFEKRILISIYLTRYRL